MDHFWTSFGPVFDPFWTSFTKNQKIKKILGVGPAWSWSLVQAPTDPPTWDPKRGVLKFLGLLDPPILCTTNHMVKNRQLIG